MYPQANERNCGENQHTDQLDFCHLAVVLAMGGEKRNASGNRPGKRPRSPTAEPVDKKQMKRDEDRKARMARLRAENDEEEFRLSGGTSSTRPNNNTNNNREGGSRSAGGEDHGSGDAGKIALGATGMIDGEELTEEEQMQRLMGFSTFSTTKNEEVEDNKKSAAAGTSSKNKARKYRQYMNRKGGFNRPLDKMR